MMNLPTLHQLKIFQHVASRESVTRAAEELYLSQSSVSLQLHRLEKAYGVKLLGRVGRRIHLTEAGRVLHKNVRTIFELLEETETAMDELKALRTERLAIGAIVGIASYVLPSAIDGFRGAYGGIEFEMLVANKREIIERHLLSNDLELGFIHGLPESRALAAEPYATDELVVIFPPTHTLARRRSVEPVDLTKEPFLAREPGSGTRLVVDRLFAELGMVLRVKAELWGAETVKQAVLRGEGVSIAAKSTIRFEVASGSLCAAPLTGVNLMSPMYVCYRTDKTLSRPALAFVDCARRAAAVMMPTIAVGQTASRL